MRITKIGFLLSLAIAAATGAVAAQETPAAPAPAATPTLMDREYDGATHITIAPYIWAPTVHTVFKYSVPALLPHRHHRTGAGVATVTPSQYASSINSAAEFSVDARKGPFDVFGDVVYLNLTATGAANALISGPGGRIQIPATFNASARLASTLWEAAAGYTLARGHDADLSGFAGIRDFPVNLTIGYNATIGRRGIIAPSGTLKTYNTLNDFIVGLRGKAYFGDGHFFVPYYIDYGSGLTAVSDQSWEAYTGAGYGFNHGQQLIATYRSLNYNAFPPNATVQKLALYGPQLTYTFNL